MLKIEKQNRGVVIALRGELGSGKTTLIKGICRGLGVLAKTTSPTFVLMRRSLIPKFQKSGAALKNVYHIDAYRISGRSDGDALDIAGLAENQENVLLVEWPDNLKRMKKIKNVIDIDLFHGKSENERKIIIRGIDFMGRLK